MSPNIVIPRQLGMKWFMFFARILPCIICSLEATGHLLILCNLKQTLSNPAVLFDIPCSLALVALQTLLFVKSFKDFAAFVKFTPIALVGYVFLLILRELIVTDFSSPSNAITTIFVVVILGLLGYFLWYRLNMRYFNKRLYVYFPLEMNINNSLRCFSVDRLLAILNQCPGTHEMMLFVNKHFYTLTQIAIDVKAQTIYFLVENASSQYRDIFYTLPLAASECANKTLKVSDVTAFLQDRPKHFEIFISIEDNTYPLVQVAVDNQEYTVDLHGT